MFIIPWTVPGALAQSVPHELRIKKRSLWLLSSCRQRTINVSLRYFYHLTVCISSSFNCDFFDEIHSMFWKCLYALGFRVAWQYSNQEGQERFLKGDDDDKNAEVLWSWLILWIIFIHNLFFSIVKQESSIYVGMMGGQSLQLVIWVTQMNYDSIIKKKTIYYLEACNCLGMHSYLIC